MNRIKKKLKENKKLLSIYFSAGFPKLDDTVEIIKELEKNNVDFLDLIGFDNEKYPDNFNLSFINDNNTQVFVARLS